jgi:hypothetical protein
VAIALDLDVGMFAALGAFTDRPHSVVSPWKGVDATVSEAVRARLAEAGAIDASGARQELRSTLAAMAASTATTTLRFVGTGVLVEYVVWISDDHGPVGLSATANEGALRLEDPGPTADIIDFVTGLVGRSPWQGLDLSLDLSIADGVVLAAIVDSLRRRILKGWATGHPVTDGPVDVAQLQAALNEPPADGFSLVEAIQRTCGIEASRAAGGLTDSLARLAQQGLVDADPSAVRLVGPCAAVPDHFAAITSEVELANACGSGADGVARLGFICVEAGVSDLLTIEWVASGIHLEAVSADTVVGYIDLFLRQPDFASGSAAAPQPHRVEPTATSAESATQLASERGAAATARGWAADTSAWRPTHLVPDGGIPAWATPDPAGVPVARIDAGVELQLLELARGWAHILCANGWSAWVNGRAIKELQSR